VEEAVAGRTVGGREDDGALDVALLERRLRAVPDVHESTRHPASRGVRERERLEGPFRRFGHFERAVPARPDGEVEAVDGDLAGPRLGERVGGYLRGPLFALVAGHPVVEFGERGEDVPRRLVGPRPAECALDAARIVVGHGGEYVRGPGKTTPGTAFLSGRPPGNRDTVCQRLTDRTRSVSV